MRRRTRSNRSRKTMAGWESRTTTHSSRLFFSTVCAALFRRVWFQTRSPAYAWLCKMVRTAPIDHVEPPGDGIPSALRKQQCLSWCRPARKSQISSAPPLPYPPRSHRCRVERGCPCGQACRWDHPHRPGGIRMAPDRPQSIHAAPPALPCVGIGADLDALKLIYPSQD